MSEAHGVGEVALQSLREKGCCCYICVDLIKPMYVLYVYTENKRCGNFKAARQL